MQVYLLVLRLYLSFKKKSPGNRASIHGDKFSRKRVYQMEINQIIARIIREIIKLFDFEYNGQPVNIDEVAVHAKRAHPTIENTDRNRYYYRVSNLREQRLQWIEKFLRHYLPFIEFHFQGVTQPVNGFRIKDLSKWSCYDSGSVYDALGIPSSYCNCNCEICYEKNNPLPYARMNCLLGMEEAKTRLKYYHRETRIGLPLAMGVYGEPFLNPKLLDIYEMAEGTDADMTVVTTNGSFLNEETCQRIAHLKGIKIVLSINSLNPENRQRVMGDARKDGTEKAFQALEYFQKYHIAFDASITGWPSVELEDIEQTVLQLEKYDPDLVRICLPGYNRYNYHDHEDLLYGHWDALVDLVKRLKKVVSFPLTTFPALYHSATSQEPIIDGIYKYSAAYEAGLKVYDHVIAYENQPVYLKTQLAAKLYQSYEDRVPEVNLRVRRDEEEFNIVLQREAASSRLGRRSFWGIFLNQTFKVTYLEKLKKLIEKHNAHDVVVYTSEIMKPAIEELVSSIDYYDQFFSRCHLALEVCPHYFWGGNIIINDIHMVSDFKRHLLEKIRENKKIDLVVIPSTIFDEWGFDLSGESIFELQQLGITLEIIQCDKIMI